MLARGVRSAMTECVGIPQPIVRLNRATLVVGIVAGVLLQQPLLTTALFAILLGAVAFGPRGSLIHHVGKRVFARRIAKDEAEGVPPEDRRLMRFNNGIALVLLGSAQIAFVLGAPVVGWILAGFVAVAASVALAGFCVGCFLFYQLKLQRTRIFGAA